ncbi:MAG: hypothetical protein R3B95_13105 [Nitrospirales bacterium]|nr:hypothetical protein [Nitrospira sp.]MDR4484133.1 hypothetical protein [Nitrospirales bacterium]
MDTDEEEKRHCRHIDTMTIFRQIEGLGEKIWQIRQWPRPGEHDYG